MKNKKYKFEIAGVIQKAILTKEGKICALEDKDGNTYKVPKECLTLTK